MKTADRCHDVVVVGARVAGSATAMLLARLGHEVVVVDRATFPSDAISTHSIARSGVVQLRRWGLLDAVLDSGAPAIRQVTFHAGGESITRTIKAKSGVDLVVAPRRYVLDAILARRAELAGADLRTGFTVTGVRRDECGRVIGVYGHDHAGVRVSIRGRYLIGADGLQSSVALMVGAAPQEVRPTGGSIQYAYYAGSRWTGIEFFVAERTFAGFFPTHDGACIWVCTPSVDARAARRKSSSRVSAFGDLVDRAAPELTARMRLARRTSPVLGMLRQPNLIRQAYGPGWALVGDAGYYRDAITAHGISDAFRDAERLAAALDQVLSGRADEATALAAYQRRRDKALREIFEVTCQLSAYPPVPRFIELQKQLSAAVDKEAVDLASGRDGRGPARDQLTDHHTGRQGGGR
jgi:flavin-dependent dehydrogenase